MVKRISAATDSALTLIRKWESFYSRSYLCPAGIWTIGYGTTRYPDGAAVRKGQTCSRPEADRWLTIRVKKLETAVDTALGVTAVNQNQFDALVSFAYNVGETAMANSQLLRLIRRNPDDPAIQAQFRRWIYASSEENAKDDDGDGVVDEKGEKKVLQGLVNRRNEESLLYFKSTLR